MSRTTRGLALAIALVLTLAACTDLRRGTIQADEVVLPTPMRSYDADVDATFARLSEALGAVPVRLAVSDRPYRPSEPQALLQTPRAILRADLADPDAGFIVVYEFDGASAARAGADELAAYLGSGFGQTNFPTDAQFSVGIVADTVVFTWWSRARADDPDRVEAVFDAVAGVGEPVPVHK